MKTKDLATVWGAPGAPRLTPKQVSIRVPILISAKISALLALFPRRTKTDIIGDLLTSALELLEKELPMRKGSDNDVYVPEGDSELQFTYLGMRKDYFKLAEKYLRKMEKEVGVKEPIEFSYPTRYSESEFRWE